MALNPLNTDALGILGLEIVHTGEFERGTAIVRRAMELNPNHAGWMHFAPLWDHFNKGEYEQALERANRVDVPGLFWPFLVMASACGHLGRRGEAAAAVRDLLALDPEFAAHARSNIGTWHFASGLMDPILDGLRKAGLSIPENDDSSDSPRRIAAGHIKSRTGRNAGERSLVPGFTFGLDRRDCSRCRRGRLVVCSSSKQASCRFVERFGLSRRTGRQPEIDRRVAVREPERGQEQRIP